MGCSDRLLYWKYKEKGKNIHLFCPIFDDRDYSIKDFRIIRGELEALENLFMFRYPYAVMYAKLEHPHIIKMITKVGYKPYFVNLKYNSIWFRKMLGGYYVR